jgi:hypothetical protein
MGGRQVTCWRTEGIVGVLARRSAAQPRIARPEERGSRPPLPLYPLKLWPDMQTQSFNRVFLI